MHEPRSKLESRRSIQPWIICGLIGVSASYAVVAAVATSRGADVSESTRILWLVVFSILVTLWSRNDKAYPVSRSTGEYSYLLMFFFWPVVLLYHLVRSRGTEGLVMYLGFAAIYMAPYLTQALAWVAVAHGR